MAPGGLEHRRDGLSGPAPQAAAPELVGRHHELALEGGAIGPSGRLPPQHGLEERHEHAVALLDGLEGFLDGALEALTPDARLTEAAPRGGLEERDAQPVDVRRGGDLAGDDVLGRHVVEGAEDELAGEALPRLEVGASHAEVQQLHRAAHGDHDVGRLDVPVDDVEGITGLGVGRDVGLVKRPRDHGADLGQAPRGHLAAGLDHGGQIDALDELHDDRVTARDAHQLADLQDALIVQQAQQPGLVAHAREELLRAGLVAHEHLDRDLSAKPPAGDHVGEVDRTDRAAAQGLDEGELSHGGDGITAPWELSAVAGPPGAIRPRAASRPPWPAGRAWRARGRSARPCRR